MKENEKQEKGNNELPVEIERRVMREHSRYPYTYCADHLRMEVGNTGDGLISRATAARIKAVIAEAIGMDEEALAKAVAEKYIEKLLPL